MIPADQATNRLVGSRRQMQAKYLGEIEGRFGLPVLVMPLLDHEVRGLPVVRHAADVLFGVGVSVEAAVAKVEARYVGCRALDDP